MAVSHRRVAAALAGLLAAAGPLLASAPAHAADAAASSSVSVTDTLNDAVYVAGNGPAVPQVDIQSASATYQDDRITLDMVTGGADDLVAGGSAVWGLFTNPAATANDNPDYIVIADHSDTTWTVLVVRGDDNSPTPTQLCPTGTSMAYDAARTSYTAAFNASCIGSPASFRFQAVRALASGDPNAPDVAMDMAPDNALSDTVTAGTSDTSGTGASHGYWMVGSDGKVYAFGGAVKIGEPAGSTVAPIVDLEPTPSGDGYWVVDELGHVYAYGTAKAFAPFDPTKLLAGEKVTSLSATPKGDGYWLFTSQGRVFTFGAAVSFGDMAGKALNGAVLDSVATPTGNGYYMVASDGGVFAFGDAHFAGSMGDKKLNAPVQSLVPDPDNTGYWLVASDGGIFAFDAAFHGSMGDKTLNKPVTGMVAFGSGYLMVGEDGGIFNFSDQPFDGSLGANPPAHPIVSVAALAKAEA